MNCGKKVFRPMETVSEHDELVQVSEKEALIHEAENTGGGGSQMVGGPTDDSSVTQPRGKNINRFR